MSNNNSIKKTLFVAISLCIVCSIIVAGAAVGLKDKQKTNKDIDRKKNILIAGGMYDESKSIDETFKIITTKIVNLETGEFNNDIDPKSFDIIKAAKDPQLGITIHPAKDSAKIKRKPKYMPVYLVQNKEQTEIKKIILPIYGKGLWSTLYGFMALEADFNTVLGLGFYSHAETPGLGGEVDNPKWKASWKGKQIYSENDTSSPLIKLIKGTVNSEQKEAIHQIDGLSGATLTSNGVTNLVQFWMGTEGYANFLNTLRNKEKKQ